MWAGGALRLLRRVALWAVSRRLEIELTSRRPDGSWTWRAAGARRPKGVVSGDIVPDTAVAGTVLKAEADAGLDGLEILAVTAPRVRAEPTGRLDLIGGRDGPAVTTTLVRQPRDRGRDRNRSRGGDGDRGHADSTRRTSGRRDERGDDGSRDRKKRKPRRSDGSKRDPRSHDSATDSNQKRRTRRSDRSDHRSADRRPRDGRRSEGARSRSPGLKAKRVHRQAVLASLPEDQQPLAREVLKAGVPGVRKSIDRMNAKAAAEKLPQIKSAPILALAEQLAPVLKAAEWHDRADAALAGIATIDLRDIRSVIAAADRATRTDETRALAESLRAALTQRLEADQRRWLDELAVTIGEGRTIRALRLSSRPPKAGTPLPVDMAERLASIAAQDLTPANNQQRWSTVVDAVALSPVRTQVVPVGVPEKPSEDLLAVVRKLADRVPQIAALFGIEPSAPSRRGRRTPPPPPPAAAAGKPVGHSGETPAATVEAPTGDTHPGETPAATVEAPTGDTHSGETPAETPTGTQPAA